MATDIAFAVAVFRIAGRHAPRGMGLMLLTLAVVDDLGRDHRDRHLLLDRHFRRVVARGARR